MALSLGAAVIASPQNKVAVVPADPGGAAAPPASTEKPADAKTPKRPDTPQDNTIMAPPLPGYALMFILGAAVVALNLWSSKRTQLD